MEKNDILKTKRTRRKRFLAMLLTMMLVASPLEHGVLVYAAESDKSATETQEEHSEVTENTQETQKPESVLSELTGAKNLNSKGYDVVYVIDNSGSISDEERKSRNQAFRNITNLAVGLDIRVGVVYFADHVDEAHTLALTSVKTKKGAEKVLKALEWAEKDDSNFYTNIGTGLEKAGSLFDSQNNSRERIIILFSDGINENLAQDKDYKNRADAKTKTQAQALKDKADIYCVYLGDDRNDVETLKDIVNYWPETETYTDTYSEERFFEVASDQVNQLSNKFIDVFYKMQNNMKCRAITFDKNGNYPFYLPSLGIEKLQVYLNGAFEGEKFYCESVEVKDATTETDGTSKFISYENPTSGDWSIEVKSSDSTKVHGIITYQTNLQAETELIFASDSKSDLARAYQLVVRFYNANKEQIALDENVDLEVDVLLQKEDGEKQPLSLKMKIKDGVATSDVFQMEDYGEYSYDIHLAYEDFVDLQYSIYGGTIEKTAPVVYPIINGDFKGEKTSDGIVFSIKEIEIFEDLEKEKVTLQNVIQLNAANPVDVVQENGYLRIVSAEDGDVNFALQLVDESGMTTEVSIQGKVTNQGIMRLVKILIIILIISMIALWILKKADKKRKEEERKRKIKEAEELKQERKEELKQKLEEFDQICAEFENCVAVCDRELEESIANEEDCEAALFGDDKLSGLLELADKLEKEQWEEFGISSYLTEEFHDEWFGVAKASKQVIEGIKNEMSELSDKINTVREKHSNLVSAIQVAKECIAGVTKQKGLLEEQCKALKEQNAKKQEEVDVLFEKTADVAQMLATEIECDLSLKNISEIPHAHGKKSALVLGKRIKGYYRLDDVMIAGHGVFGSEIGKSGIYVYSYKDNMERVGLRLTSANAFTYQLLHEEEITAKELILLQNMTADVKITIGRRIVSVTIIVS